MLMSPICFRSRSHTRTSTTFCLRKPSGRHVSCAPCGSAVNFDAVDPLQLGDDKRTRPRRESARSISLTRPELACPTLKHPEARPELMPEATPTSCHEVPSALSTWVEVAARAYTAFAFVWMALGICVLLQVPLVTTMMGLRLPRTSAQLANLLCISLRIVIERPWMAINNAAALWANVAPAVAAIMAVDTVMKGLITARLRSMYPD